MHFLSLSPKQLALLLQLLTVATLRVLATCGDGAADGAAAGAISQSSNEASPEDGETSDGTAGIGIELETSAITFVLPGCPEDVTNSAKAKLVGNRQDTSLQKLWRLTGDTLTDGEKGLLTCEYILNGETIKLGYGQVGPAARAVFQDLSTWNPWEGMANSKVEIEGINPAYKTWSIGEPKEEGKAIGARFTGQITAPLALESISDLIHQAKTSETKPFLLNGAQGISVAVDVRPEFFQTNPLGIKQDAVKGDVLGFFSLILSTAKATDGDGRNGSPKLLTGIMPRNDYTTVFDQVRKYVQPNGGTLYDLVKILACYMNSGDTVVIDEKYCDGTPDKPQPRNAMDNQLFNYDGKDVLKVKDWIDSIENQVYPDKLTTFDKHYDGQIGYFRGRLEKLYNSKRKVPLFEFRSLRKVLPPGFEQFALDAENALLDYHKRDPARPAAKRFKRSMRGARSTKMKRKDDSSCSTRSATSAPAPTIAVFLSNNTIPVGTANNENNGTKLLHEVFGKLQAICGDTDGHCDSTKTADINGVSAVFGTIQQQESLVFTVEDSAYDNAQDRDRLLAVAIAGWQQAVANSCNTTTYTILESEDEAPGCAKRRHKRSDSKASRILGREPDPEPIDIGGGSSEELCTREEHDCVGPDHISVVTKGNNGTYGQHIDIGVKQHLDGGSAFAAFICKLVIEQVEGALARFAPELAGEEAIEGSKLMAYCDDLDEDS